VRVRLIDLDNCDGAHGQETDEPGSVGAGRFDPDQPDLAEALEPHQQLPVAASSRRKDRVAEQPTLLVERDRVVTIGVGVDAARDQTPDLRHPVPAVLSRTRAAPAGTGGHNSDEALVASRFLSGHAAPTGRPRGNRSRAPARADRSANRQQPVSFRIGQTPARHPL
jgi:hypothetical protein